MPEVFRVLDFRMKYSMVAELLFKAAKAWCEDDKKRI